MNKTTLVKDVLQTALLVVALGSFMWSWATPVGGSVPETEIEFVKEGDTNEYTVVLVSDADLSGLTDFSVMSMALDYIEDQVEEATEDGIVTVSCDDMVVVAGVIKSYTDDDDIEYISEAYGIEIEGILNSDFSSLDGWAVVYDNEVLFDREIVDEALLEVRDLVM